MSVDVNKFIRFGFASKRRKIMLLVIGVVGIFSSFFGGSSKDIPSSSDNTGIFYANCGEAKAAGVAPLHKGTPGYRSEMDRNDDGIACE